MQAQGHTAVGKPCLQPRELDADYRAHMIRRQAVEQQNLVKPVQEFRAEGRLHIRHHRVARGIAVLAIRQRQQMVSPDIRCQQDDGVGEIHTPSLPVGQVPLIQHLQQDVENIGMRLLDLVEQHHLIGAAAHRLGQRAALLIADIARGRTDQTRHRVLFHIFRHIDAQHRAVIVEQKTGKRLGHFGLADTGRPQHQETAHRLVRVGQAGARPAGGIGDSADCLGLADDPLADLGLHAQQLLALAFQHLVDRDTGPAADHRGDLRVRDLFIDKVRFRQRILGSGK